MKSVSVKVRSDRKWWTPWTAQDYIQSSCKDMIRCNFTSGAANLVIQVIQITQYGVHRLITRSWKYWTLCCDHQTVLRFSWHQWHPDGTNQNLVNGHWIRQSSQAITVCEYRGAPTTWLYTLRDYLMNTDTASLNFPTFLGPQQLILCKKDD